MAVTDVSKYETVNTELWTKIKPDLTRPKISSGIDWDGLFELKMQSWPNRLRYLKTQPCNRFQESLSSLLCVALTTTNVESGELQSPQDGPEISKHLPRRRPRRTRCARPRARREIAQSDVGECVGELSIYGHGPGTTAWAGWEFTA